MDELRYNTKYNITNHQVNNAVFGDDAIINVNQGSNIIVEEKILKGFEQLLIDNKIDVAQLNEVKRTSKEYWHTLEKFPTKVLSYIKDISVEVAAELIKRTIFKS